jgi:Ca2+-binding RTX toxin-like protein
VDAQVRVIVSYKDGQGFRESISSTTSQKILDTNDAPSGLVTLSGVATEDKVIALNTTGLIDDDGLGDFQYAWQASKDGEIWGSRPGAFAGALQLGDQDVGMYLRGVVKYVDGHGNYETVYSQSIGPVTAVNDSPLGDLTLNGLLSSGLTLSVDYSDIRDTDGLGLPSFDWFRASSTTGLWTKITSTSVASYTLSSADIAQYLRVDLKYTDKQGFAETVSTKTDRIILGGVDGRTPGELLAGTIKDDFITASAQDDNISAGAGNDQIDAGKGADVIDAGTGNDAVYLTADGVWSGGYKAARLEYSSTDVSSVAEYVVIDGRNRFFDVIDGNTGVDTIVLTETYNGDAFFLHDFFSDFNANKSSSFVIDSKGNTGTSRMSGVERILGGQGNDIIDVTSPTFTLGDIEIQGNQGADALWGGDGNDTLDGGAGTDTLAGGRGNDQFVLRLGESNATTALADHIRDFKVGSDKFALSGGLRFTDLVIQAVPDTDGVNKLAIKSANGSEIYAILDNMSASDLGSLASASFISYANDEKITLTGVATEDQSLSIDTAGIKSKAADAPLKVQWQVLNAVNGWETLTEGAATTFTLGQAQVGHLVRALATYTDIYGFERSYTTEPSTTVTNVNDAPQGLPTVTGKLTVGESLYANVTGITDEDGLGAFGVTWQASANGVTWSDLSGTTGSAMSVDASLVGKFVRSKVAYTDGWGTSETIYSTATDLVYGFSGQSVVFPKNDEPNVYNIKINQDLKRANSFAIDFDFTFNSAKVVSNFSGKDTIADISLIPTQPSSAPLNIKLTSTLVDVSYDQWKASSGSSLIGDVSSQDRYTLASGTYKVHIELKSLNGYQDFIAVVSKYGADGSLTDVGQTSASLTLPVFNDSRDFNAYVDGSYESGVSTLDNFKLGVTRIPKLFEEFTGTPDDDVMYGTSMKDVMYGFEGGDTIYGLEADDTIYGGDGNDLISGGRNNDSLLGGSGNDTILGDTGNDVIVTGAGDDFILGGLDDDTVIVDSWIGHKTIDGGSGSDTMNIAIGVELQNMLITYSGGTQSGGAYEFKTASGDSISFKNFETLDVNSKNYQIFNDNHPNWGARGDLLDGGYSFTSVLNHAAGSSEAENIAVLFTNASASQFTNYSPHTTRLADFTKPLHIYGSTAIDYIVLGGRWVGMGGNTYASYYVESGAGNDQIDATTSSSDKIYAGSGDDIVYVDVVNLTRNTIVDGGDGVDTLAFSLGGRGTAGAFNLSMGSATGFENIFGTAQADTITGDAQANELRGGAGADTLYGLAGNDKLVGDEADQYGNSTYNFRSWSYNQSTTGADKLYGGSGNDTLEGGGGDDILDGGTGRDSLTGGTGSDAFVLRAGDGGATVDLADVITDFADGTDLLMLVTGMSFSQLKMSAGTGTHANNTFIQYGNEYLVELVGIAPSQLSAIDFTS